jgi:hypothetical protein
MQENSNRSTIRQITEQISNDENASKEAKYDIKTALLSIGKTEDIPKLKSIAKVLLDDAKDREFFIRQDIEYIALLNVKLMKSEFALFLKLKRAYDNLDEHDKERFQRQIDNERKRIITNDFHELVLESGKLCRNYEEKLSAAPGCLYQLVGCPGIFVYKTLAKLNRCVINYLRHLE